MFLLILANLSDIQQFLSSINYFQENYVHFYIIIYNKACKLLKHTLLKNHTKEKIDMLKSNKKIAKLLILSILIFLLIFSSSCSPQNSYLAPTFTQSEISQSSSVSDTEKPSESSIEISSNVQSEAALMITSAVSEAISTEPSVTVVSEAVATKAITIAPAKIPTKAPTKVPTKTPIEITINIGDFIQIGRYYDEPILWRCVDIDSNGLLMLADRILTIRPFDASGAHKYMDGTPQADDGTPQGDYENARRDNGSNLWETSNIRSWLNSTATAGNVTWLGGNPPTVIGYTYGYIDVAKEKGFMADDNFTASERNAIMSVTQKSILHGIDANKLKEGGTSNLTWNANISTVVQNYDTAFYNTITDKMFLLDVKQINQVWQNGSVLGTNYYIGKPTQKAIDNSPFKGKGHTPSDYMFSWLRTPTADSYDCQSFVRVITFNGSILDCAAAGGLGVRPAFYLNLSFVIFKSGNGTETNPYILK